MAKMKSKTIYTCQKCGAQRARWEGRCSDCGEWNSFVEEFFSSEPGPTSGRGLSSSTNRGWSTSQDLGSLLNLDQNIETLNLVRFDTSINELNRVLGGGLAKGSFVLLGGSPGIGKSTLLLQMAGGIAKNNLKVLYISGEESVSQTANRAHRLGIRSPHVQIGAESNLNQIINLARSAKPDVMIIDSIQTVYLEELQAAPGSVSQVRECAGHLMSLAKQQDIAVILVGHVTKDGSLAGPKVLEHMVDCVLSFEGDTTYNFRLLRTLKNRFGTALELGVFNMSSKGLEEVANPSELFLEERGEQLIGSVVFASMEGTRPLLCEIQALTVGSHAPMPRRTSVGIDINRLHLLGAVLERHLDLKLNQSDIFVNVVGGLKLVEPACDLALGAAILSTEKRRSVQAKSCFFGEIGLTGEIRGVSFADIRLKEADKLGFETFYLPASNKKSLSDLTSLSPTIKNKDIIFLKNIKDLAKFI